MRISDWSSDVCSSDLRAREYPHWMTDTTIDCLRPADRGIQCKRQQGDGLNHRAMLDPIVRALGRCRANRSEASANYNRMDGSGWHGAQDCDRKSAVQGKSVSIRV